MKRGLSPDNLPAFLNVTLDIKPEQHEKVNQDRRSQRDKRHVNEIEPNPSRSYAHLFSEVAANAKGGFLEKVLHGFHGMDAFQLTGYKQNYRLKDSFFTNLIHPRH